MRWPAVVRRVVYALRMGVVGWRVFGRIHAEAERMRHAEHVRYRCVMVTQVEQRGADDQLAEAGAALLRVAFGEDDDDAE